MNIVPYRKLTSAGLTGTASLIVIMLCAAEAPTTTSATTSPAPTGKYHGILINSASGTQLYDPFNAPNAQGNLTLGLQTGNAAQVERSGGAAVANGPLAYFAGGGGVYLHVIT
jgi:hypothetical protein